MAVRIINDRMGLNLLTADDMFRQSRNQKIQRAFDQIRNAMDAIIDSREEQIEAEQRFLTKWLTYIEDKPIRERTADEWVRRELILEEMKYNDYLAEKAEELRREVSEWRSRARSGKSR